ncbi:hypothetical protein ACKI1J_16875 [Streptomyces scabiei]|uniref:hypothetical protein n=1 Tax=Streptomyces scabiei TaxID=1930 RepID=UPI0038F7F539
MVEPTQSVPTPPDDPRQAALTTLFNGGTVIVVEAGDALDRSGVWNANEVRLIGPAPTAVRQRLVEKPTWRTDDTKVPIRLMIRVSDGFAYLGRGSVTRAGMVLDPDRNEHVLTDCALQLDSPLSKSDLDRVRPSG